MCVCLCMCVLVCIYVYVVSVHVPLCVHAHTCVYFIYVTGFTKNGLIQAVINIWKYDFEIFNSTVSRMNRAACTYFSTNL